MTTETLEAPDEAGLERHGHRPPSFWILTLGSIGVVYGDIGTSPLYAVRVAVLAATHKDGVVSETAIYGVLSLIIWALILVVTVKYVLILLNADNQGEGGTLSLMALAQRVMGSKLVVVPILAMIGAALFYGDAMITPAISVLSAIEGINVVTPELQSYVLPITVGIIIGLFMVQTRGTASVASLFGPVTLLWFVAIGLAGIPHIVGRPGILAAFDPLYAIDFLSRHGIVGLFTLGAVFLAVTGAEALYADLGHFGKRPIQFAWLFIVLPALLLNYLGQGALLIANPQAIDNPFFLMVPTWGLIPLVVLATAATIIASQAVITGAYSMTRQAIQLGLLPRMEIRFTSEAHAGQVYLPQVNWLLLAGVLGLALAFQNSSSLASAYGIAVTGTMVVTSAMAIPVIWKYWNWPLWAALALIGPLLALDVIFLGANSLKVLGGGWVPLALGGLMLLVMWTWRRGTRILFEKSRRLEVPMADLAGSLARRSPHRVAGTAVFFTSDPQSAPTALLHSLKHYRVLHEHNVILTVRTSDLPVVVDDDKLKMEKINDLFSRLIVTFGYMETPNVPRALGLARKHGWKFDIMTTSFFLSRRSVLKARTPAMPAWQDKLFIGLARNADDASRYFHLPTDRVVEVGTQITV
ncbi:MAG: potassium transporter Kup [Rhizobiales bacterium]|nr:potassium transporter Kup [Hyphomicrobiales bacterium]MBI3672684.1 potassium transporter Kup [Hyphomicrobiales bacterium]